MHDHDHLHTQGDSVSKEERIALLKYMLGHNAHHAEELHELAHGCEGTAAELLHMAVDDIKASNAKLEEALRLLTEE